MKYKQIYINLQNQLGREGEMIASMELFNTLAQFGNFLKNFHKIRKNFKNNEILSNATFNELVKIREIIENYMKNENLNIIKIYEKHFYTIKELIVKIMCSRTKNEIDNYLLEIYNILNNILNIILK